jgi:hypothetical protein
MRSPPHGLREIYGYVVPGVRITVAPLSMAMSWSGTRNLPGRSFGQFMAPRALNFSAGSARKYASVVWVPCDRPVRGVVPIDCQAVAGPPVSRSR